TARARSRRRLRPGARRRPRVAAWAECGRRSSGGLPGAGAELDVVDVVRDRRVLAADGAGRIAADRDLVELRGQRVEQEQPADKGFADSEQELQRLARLQRADDSGEHAEHAALRA